MVSFNSVEDRTQTKPLSTQRELSFSRSIYSTLWKKQKLAADLMDPRGKHSPYNAHASSVELKVPENQVQENIQT